MRTLPANRTPIHPGEMLHEEYLKPLGISQSDFAKAGDSGRRFRRFSRCAGATGFRPRAPTGTSVAGCLGQEWEGLGVPVSPAVETDLSLELVRRGKDAGPDGLIFPSPNDPTKPLSLPVVTARA